MTKAERDAHLETLEAARTAAEKAFRRVMQETDEKGLLGPLNAVNDAFANAVNRLNTVHTED